MDGGDTLAVSINSMKMKEQKENIQTNRKSVYSRIVVNVKMYPKRS